MGITSTKNLKNLLGDVRRTNNFILTIPEVTENTDLELIVQKAFLPKVSLNVIELRHGNDALKFAGVASWEGGQVTILDTLKPDELDAVLAWFSKTYDWKTGAIGYAADYKKSGVITEYAANSEFVREWNVSGLWISELDPGQLDATSGEMKQISFTVQIDPPKGDLYSYRGYPTE